MKYRILNSEVKNLINNKGSGVVQTVKIQVRSVGNIFVSTQPSGSDLQQLDITGSPVNGTKLSQASSIEDGTYENFVGELWARSDVGVDVDVSIHNSPVGIPQPVRPRRGIPYNAPNWGNT